MEATHELALRRGVRLEVVTVAWMVIEAIAAIGAGIAATSVLLTAFGADSVIELLSGIVLLRRLSAEARGAAVEGVERLEKASARISAVLLALLCVYVVATSIAGFALRIAPRPSAVGLAVSAAALVAMPLLALMKGRANRVIGSPSLRADIAETVTCAYMAAVTLVGLAASIAFGWWWIEYLAALALLAWLLPEMREALEAARKA